MGTATALADLVWAWRDHRWEGDEAVYEPLEAWRRQNKRLYEEESHLRAKLLRRRREFYRVFAARISALHGGLVLTGDDVMTDDGLNSLRRRPGGGAVSHLRNIVTWAWNKRHGSPVEVVILSDVRLQCPQGHTCDPPPPQKGSGQVWCPTCDVGVDADMVVVERMLELGTLGQD